MNTNRGFLQLSVADFDELERLVIDSDELRRRMSAAIEDEWRERVCARMRSLSSKNDLRY
jgi:hypothetical protein